MIRWLCGLALGFAAGAALTGCGTGPSKQPIHGVVTLDSKPLPAGHVRFTPVGGKGSGADEFIKDGQYTAKLLAGDYKVEVYSPRVTGKMTNRPPGAGANADAVEETIPGKYNVQSTLKAEVKPGVEEINFPLTTK